MSRSKTAAKFAALFALLAAAMVLALCVGAVSLSIPQLIDGISNAASTSGQILHAVRLPRLFAALLAGSALAVSGLITQAVLSNPLASPSVIGVNSGAGFFSAVVMAFFPSAGFLLPAAAFFGALFAVLLVFGIAKRARASKLTLVLAGVAVSSLMTAGISAVTTCFPDIVLGMRDFQIGGFSGVTLSSISTAAIIISVGLTLSILLAGELEILGLGEESARSLGLNVTFWRAIFLVLAAMLCGAAVSFSGLISFVGLIVPHSVRLLFPRESKRVQAVACVLLGAAFTALCDTAARSVFSPFELPVGILIAFFGAPFFLWLIFSERRWKNACA